MGTNLKEKEEIFRKIFRLAHEKSEKEVYDTLMKAGNQGNALAKVSAAVGYRFATACKTEDELIGYIRRNELPPFKITEREMEVIRGGHEPTKDTSLAHDIGYAISWVCGAIVQAFWDAC